MIRIDGRVARYGEVWFDEPVPHDPTVDILTFRQRSHPIADRPCTPFLSLVNDLSLDENGVFAGFGNTNRYKIKRAESKDGLQADFLADPRPRLEEFSAFYDAFARQKAIEPCYRRGLDAACDAGQLVLTFATHDGNELVWHAYVTYGDSVALFYSASHFRGKERADRALLGRANRWLHWRDMLGFKQMGLSRYDWGGLFEDESVAERAGINNFKREFGGRPICTYNCRFAVTGRGRAYLAARRALDWLSAAS